MPKSAAAVSEHPAARAFGELLRDYRAREGLSQRKVAAILGVDESTIARIEAGTRKPPRDVSFYKRLRDVPGLTESEIAALLRTDGAPHWLVPERDSPTDVEDVGQSAPSSASAVASAAGFKIVLRFHPAPGVFAEDELETIRKVVKQDVESCLRDFLRRRADRGKLLNQAD